jgi:serine/threonine-protein kinase
MSKKTKEPLPSPGAILFHTGDIAFEYLCELGKGPHGERVLLARPRNRGEVGGQVAIKVLSPMDDAKARKRLTEEVQLALRLSHPSIARVHGLHTQKGSLFAVLEYVEGRSLDALYYDALMAGRWCSEPFVLYVAAELAGALSHAHTLTDEAGQPLGVVHRDLHPQSIIVEPSGSVKLTDFGLATSRLAGRLATTLPRERGHVVYASPEQLLRRPVDARSDLFALGLVMLELLTGQHLFWLLEDVDLRQLVKRFAALSPEGRQAMDAVIDKLGALNGAALAREDREQMHERAKVYGFEDLERVAREVPEPTRFILHKLLRHEPGERYQTAAELEAALRERLRAVGPFGAREAAQEVLFLQAVAAGVPPEEATPPEDAERVRLADAIKTARDEDKIPTAPGPLPWTRS